MQAWTYIATQYNKLQLYLLLKFVGKNKADYYLDDYIYNAIQYTYKVATILLALHATPFSCHYGIQSLGI